MASLSSKMDEADQHLDRLGGILRSLRAPPSDRALPPTLVGRNQHARHARRSQQQERTQEQRVWQQQHEQRDERPHASSGRSPSPRPLTAAPQPSSRTEVTTTAPLLHPRPHRHQGRLDAERSAEGRTTPGAGTGVACGPQPRPSGREWRAGGGGMRYERLDYEDDGRRVDDAAPEPPPPPSGGGTSAGLEGRGGGGGGGGGGGSSSGIAKTSPSSPLPFQLSLRVRAVRAWWRGLSCGVCFAAGAWARDGHGVFAVMLALAAVCGETMLYSNMRVT